MKWSARNRTSTRTSTSQLPLCPVRAREGSVEGRPWCASLTPMRRSRPGKRKTTLSIMKKIGIRKRAGRTCVSSMVRARMFHVWLSLTQSGEPFASGLARRGGATRRRNGHKRRRRSISGKSCPPGVMPQNRSPNIGGGYISSRPASTSRSNGEYYGWLSAKRGNGADKMPRNSP